MERIKGTAIDKEIDQLIHNKRWLKIHITSNDYERISVITQKKIIGGEDCFQVDTPPDLNEIIVNASNKIELKLEFRGSDNIRYQFSTKHWQLINSQLWIVKPDSIDRIQNRNNFRVAAPLESHLIVQQDSTQLIMRLENISIGGAFASTHLTHPHHSSNFKPEVGEQIAGIQLSFPVDIMENSIHVLQAQIIRIEKGFQKSRVGYALHFIEIDSIQKNLLTRAVYHLQRRFLQTRIRD
jgi:c-di-GMP-binding flagellar brake protein YcgR